MTTTDIHDQALNWFVRLRDDEVPETVWLDFQDWLEGDPARRKAYDLVEQVWLALEEAAPTDEAMPEPAPVLTRPAARRALPRWTMPAMAAAVATVAVVGLWPEISGQGRFQTFTTDGEVREVVLPDGSTVSMNRHSSLRARIGKDHRDVVLSQGEAAFDVTHDADRPFVVAADDHEIRVLGTAFNVLNHGETFAVEVQRGVVAVSGDTLSDAVRLTAGRRIQQSGAEPAVVSDVTPAQAAAWRQGVLIYRDADLGAIADDLSRYLDEPVSVSPSARALRFTGALRIGDEATMLGQLQDFVPIRVIRSNDGVRLTARDGG